MKRTRKQRRVGDLICNKVDTWRYSPPVMANEPCGAILVLDGMDIHDDSYIDPDDRDENYIVCYKCDSWYDWCEETKSWVLDPMDV